MRALKDKVILERCKKEEKKSLVILPDEKPSNKYSVVSIGANVVCEISVGDIVMAEKYGLTEIENDQKRELFICNENIILLAY